MTFFRYDLKKFMWSIFWWMIFWENILNLQYRSDNRETTRRNNVLRTSSSAEIFSNTTGGGRSAMGRLFG